MVLTNVISLRELDEQVDWPIVVLLAATIPLGGALERTGAAHTIANEVLALSQSAPLVVALALLLVLTTVLSNMVNNAATAVLMAPIALNMTVGLEASPDPFLITIAISTALPLLFPLKHQVNILVIRPNKYRFSDY